MYRENIVKQKLKAGKNVLGTFSTVGSSSIVELHGITGLDFVIIDHEHGQGDFSTLAYQLQALSSTPARSLVRIPENDYAYLKRVQDLGVEGVLIPNIETAEDAMAAVSACRYPPHGRRGAGAAGSRVSSYGMASNYEADYADNFIIALQIESVKGVDEAEKILAVPGVDVLFVGPADLSLSAGYPRQFNHPEMIKIFEKLERAIKNAGVAMGSTTYPGKTPIDMFHKGYNFITTKSEVARVRDGNVADVKAFREAFPD